MARLSCPRKAVGIPALLQCVVITAACMSWRAEPVAPAELISRQNPPVVRVTRSDGSRLILRDPEIRGDTLYGSTQDSLEDKAKGRSGIPLAGVTAIETRRLDGDKTIVLGAGVAIGTSIAMCLLAETFGCGDDPAFLVSLGRVK